MRLRGVTVLLVEDDVDNLELLCAVLEAEGARTFCAGSIAAALSQTDGQEIDVVVSDLELPDGDGCELLRQLRRASGKPELPAIAVTGYSELQWRQEAASCGFARYAVKPFSLQHLVEWIVELSDRFQSAVSA